LGLGFGETSKKARNIVEEGQGRTFRRRGHLYDENWGEIVGPYRGGIEDQEWSKFKTRGDS